MAFLKNNSLTVLKSLVANLVRISKRPRERSGGYVNCQSEYQEKSKRTLSREQIKRAFRQGKPNLTVQSNSVISGPV